MASRSYVAAERALDALALMRREGLTFDEAIAATGTNRAAMHRYVGPGLRRSGRTYVATPFDRIPRAMHVMTPSGPDLVIVRDSRTASKLSRQANAIRRYRDSGDEAALNELADDTVTIGGQRYRLRLDPDTLDRLIEGAEVHYDLYAR